MEKYHYAIGRRKRSVATVRLFEGKGESLVNGKPSKVVFNLGMEQKRLGEPLEVTNNQDKFYFTAKAQGGGRSGQIGAIVHALARSLVKADNDFRGELKKAGLLRRDDRKSERKKTGLRKARKSPQYSKR